MQIFTNARETLMTSLQRILRTGSTSADQRQVFKNEFGFFPADFEATAAERAVFAKESVLPVLERRARVVASLDQEASTDQQVPVTAASQDEKLASFTRAYRIATSMKLAEQGRTYKDYLPASGKSYQDYFAGKE
jgi:hypothetical protein